ncbi:uncharacterized protein LOC120711811 isoform X2 [Panicum virgatum]|uniref:uncharacterized protein LOC120711811 isoform X2 n=1 Tax=Panicum virgatum TaxID=38727 RepID=UPI0019D56CF7|nr:uncharacterized protein LOC120711811 isoform X2 [Panicum virgatum]
MLAVSGFRWLSWSVPVLHRDAGGLLHGAAPPAQVNCKDMNLGMAWMLQIHSLFYRSMVLQFHKKFYKAIQSMGTTLKCPEVWRPCVYMFVSHNLGLDIQGGMFCWYTDHVVGPGFSELLGNHGRLEKRSPGKAFLEAVT